MAGAAVLGRLNWLPAEVTAAVEETPHVRTLVLDVPDWAGGTRIGDSLLTFNRVWALRVVDRHTIVLILSSLTVALAVDAAQKGNRSRTALMLGLTVICAAGFLGIKYIEYSDKLGDPFGHSYGHQTLVYTEGRQSFVYDGHVHPHGADAVQITGYRIPAPEAALNLHAISERDIKLQSGQKEEETQRSERSERAHAVANAWAGGKI